MPIEQALDHVYAYALGLDMTRRDLQRAMGDEEEALGDRQELRPLRAHRPAATWPRRTGHFTQGAHLAEGQRRRSKQNANLSQMIWSVAEQISKLSRPSSSCPATSSSRHAARTSAPWCAATASTATSTGLPDLSVKIV
jgi:2-keto-4-pentenoate hydratase/2-oxohepta-3-ene-1,7-dioic acid hydratase in catechol pathway